MTEETKLTREELARYNRHLILPNVGIEGQTKLKNASVLLIGAGGLGSPLGMYLAAAGVGRIGLVDYDVVDESNLQRQIIHGTGDVGQPKLESAARRILDINPYVQIDKYETALTSENALEILAPYDVIVDGTDNFPTRYLTNDACVLLGKPNVYGSIYRFEGQVTVFHPAAGGPCYRCLYPDPPPPGLVPSCAEGGVLGILPGTIGTLQATEVIKLILGIGESMMGRLMLYDALTMDFDEVRLRKNPNCPACSENPTVTALIDYEQFCGMPAHDHSTFQSEGEGSIPQISPTALKTRLDNGDKLFILDVREPHEWEIANLAQYGAVLIPKGEVLDRVDELDQADEIIIHCKAGGRSAAVLRELSAIGFNSLLNLDGGINRWATEVDTSLPTY